MTKIRATNITWHEGHVTREEREKLLKQKGCLIWFTGLSGSGKSSIAYTVEHALAEEGRLCYVLDGDNIRHGLNKNLGFSAVDREENIRRIGEVGKLFVDTGVIAMTAFISPYRADRDAARALLKEGEFVEVFMDVPIDICEQRDPKGLYEKALRGEIKNFTGISSPYEEPQRPELVVETDLQSTEEIVEQIIRELVQRNVLSSG